MNELEVQGMNHQLDLESVHFGYEICTSRFVFLVLFYHLFLVLGYKN